MARTICRRNIAAILVAALCCAPGAVSTARGETAEDLYLLASNHFKHQRWELAADEYGRLLAASPDHALAAKARFYAAEALTRAGRFADAADAWRRYFEVAGEPALEAAAQFRRGEACYFADRNDDARREFLHFCDRFPDSLNAPRALFYLGGLAQADGNWHAAAGFFGHLTAAFPEHELFAAAAKAQAASLMAGGDLIGAWTVLRSLEAAESSDAATALLIGEVHDGLRRDSAALAAYARFLEIAAADDPRRGDVVLACARVYHRAGRLVEAHAAYERLTSEYPKFPARDVALYESAWVLKDLQREADAAARFAQLCDEQPRSALRADAEYRIAEIAFVGGRFAEAARRAQASLDAGPNAELHPHVLYLLGATALAERRFDDAESALARLVREVPNHDLADLAAWRLAETAYSAGNWDQAEQRSKRLLAAAPAARQPWHGEARLLQTRAQIQARKWNDAIASATEAKRRLSQAGDLYEFDYLAGRAYAALAQFREAREAYRAVVDCPQARGTETAAAAQFMIAESYFHQRDYATALREYLRAEILHDHPAWQAAALLQAGKCQEQLGQASDARHSYEQLITEFAASPYAAEAQRRRDEVVRQASAAGNAIQRK